MIDAQAILEKAKAAITQGDQAGARKLLDDLVFHEPDNEQAWLLLSEVVTDTNEKKDCLRQAYRINPSNPNKKAAAVILADQQKAEKEKEKKEQRRKAKESRAQRRKEQAAEKKKLKKSS